MQRILSIETSGFNCSVHYRLSTEKGFTREQSDERYIHAEKLHVFIDEVIREAGVPPTAIAVSAGPGSYTGLRIGVSAAKGLAFGYGIPLISVLTLDHFARQVIADHPGFDAYIPLLDARRMECYTALYSKDGTRQKSTSAEIIDENSFKDILSKGSVLFFGDGSSKCEAVITHQNAHFIHDLVPSAVSLYLPALEKLQAGQIEDLASFEPFYLKQFVAGTPKQLL